jgi:hypothetical protein
VRALGAIGSDMLFCQFFAVSCLLGCSRQRWARPQLRRRVAHLCAGQPRPRPGAWVVATRPAGRVARSTQGVPLGIPIGPHLGVHLGVPVRVATPKSPAGGVVAGQLAVVGAATVPDSMEHQRFPPSRGQAGGLVRQWSRSASLSGPDPPLTCVVMCVTGCGVGGENRAEIRSSGM